MAKAYRITNAAGGSEWRCDLHELTMYASRTEHRARGSSRLLSISIPHAQPNVLHLANSQRTANTANCVELCTGNSLLILDVGTCRRWAPFRMKW